MKHFYIKHGIRFIILFFTINGSAQSFFNVEPLFFNTKEYSELNAIPYKDGIIFCSNRKTTVLSTQLTANDEPLLDIYFVSKNGDKWNVPKLFDATLNTKFHDGPVSFDSKNSILYFTQNAGKSLKEDNTLGIFLADVNGTGIENIRPFEFNSEEYNVAYPSISFDGNTLYFCMDKRGGFGGYDIYESALKNGKWSEPQNLGEIVNTKGNDVFPFIHPSGRLYFSTNRIPFGLGRHDIYYTDYFNGQWSKPVNMGDPINSKRDDFSLYIDEDFESGYLTSDRNRSIDLFSIESNFPEFDTCMPIQKNNYCFVFYETGSMSLDTTSLRYEWDLGDGTKVRGLEASHCFSGPGFYLVQLNVIDTITGDIYFSEASYDFNLEDIQQTIINSPDTFYVGDTIKFDAIDSHIKDFTVENYYWDFDDGDKAVNEIVNHAYRKPGEYKLRLGAVSVSDKKSQSRSLCSFKNVIALPRRTNLPK